MLVIIHGNIKTMEARDYEDGYLQIEDGKITALGDMKDCKPGRWKGEEIGRAHV